MLTKYDPSQQHFLGPSNLWPDDTLHKTAEFPAGSQKTGLHHPCNGAYCMSHTLVEAIYPHMTGGKFSASCSTTPDDIAITDLVYNTVGVKLTVINEFHHQHSKNYKLPYYEVQRLKATAVTLCVLNSSLSLLCEQFHQV